MPRPRRPAMGLLALLAVFGATGCFGMFHELAGDHATARVFFWTDVTAIAVGGAIEVAEGRGEHDRGFFLALSVISVTGALDLWGLVLFPGGSCRPERARVTAFLTPTHAAVAYRF